jgi:hypothetical protein
MTCRDCCTKRVPGTWAKISRPLERCVECQRCTKPCCGATTTCFPSTDPTRLGARLCDRCRSCRQLNCRNHLAKGSTRWKHIPRVRTLCNGCLDSSWPGLPSPANMAYDLTLAPAARTSCSCADEIHLCKVCAEQISDDYFLYESRLLNLDKYSMNSYVGMAEHSTTRNMQCARKDQCLAARDFRVEIPTLATDDRRLPPRPLIGNEWRGGPAHEDRVWHICGRYYARRKVRDIQPGFYPDGQLFWRSRMYIVHRTGRIGTLLDADEMPERDGDIAATAKDGPRVRGLCSWCNRPEIG